MAIKIRPRRDTGANWTAADPVLDMGEIGVETDHVDGPKPKIGDGVTPWTLLPYLAADGADGADGRSGEQWWTYDGVAPDDLDGEDGDLALRVDTGDIFEKAAGAWGVAIGNIMGPAGAGGSGTATYEPAGTTAADIQTSIDAASAAGGGIVQLDVATYTIEATLSLPSLVTLRGIRESTLLQAANGLNANVIESAGFSTLVGTNAWFIGADSVPYGMAIEDLIVDGNRANNVSGRGIALYAKRFKINDGVIVYNCAEEGLYTEAGDVVGQAHVYADMPEADIDIKVRGCGGNGVTFRGPHDAIFHSVVSSGNDGYGFKNEGSAGVYNGTVDIEHMHVYSNTTGGAYLGASTRLKYVMVDMDDLTVAADRCEIGIVKALTPTFTTAVQVTGDETQIDLIQGDITAGNSGIAISGARNSIGQVFLHGNSGAGTGVSIGASTCHIGGGVVTNFGAVGGVGLDIAAAVSLVNARLTINNCATQVQYGGGGAANLVEWNGFVGTGTIFSGTPHGTDRFHWTANGANGGHNAPRATLNIVSKTANYTLVIYDNEAVVEVDATTGPVTITLPAGLLDGFQCMIVKTDASANAVTLAGDGTSTLVGKGTQLTAQHDAATIYRKAGDVYRAVGDLA